LFIRHLSIAVIVKFFMLSFILPVQANGECEILQKGSTGIVAKVVDGDSLLLSNGNKIRLIGIQAPKLALGREGFKDWPLAKEAKAALEEITLDKTVRLEYGGARVDRYDRVLAHLFVLNEKKEIWVQREMLERGFARVYSFADNRSCLEPLLQAEARARVEKKNIWANSYYNIRYANKPDKLLPLVDHYELVEGAVLSAKRVGSRRYLNFGETYQNDFTIVIEKSAWRLFKKAGIKLSDYQNALIRVRGWVEIYGGPRIEVTHPEQIEILAIKSQ